MNINGAGKEASVTTVAMMFFVWAMEAPDVVTKIVGVGIGFGLLTYKYYTRENGIKKK